MAWRDNDYEHDEPFVTHDHTRAIVWGALAVVLLGVVGVLVSFLQ